MSDSLAEIIDQNNIPFVKFHDWLLRRDPLLESPPGGLPEDELFLSAPTLLLFVNLTR